MCNGNRNYKGMRRRELLIIGLGTSLSSSNFVEEVRKTVGLLVAVLGTPIKKKKRFESWRFDPVVHIFSLTRNLIRFPWTSMRFE